MQSEAPDRQPLSRFERLKVALLSSWFFASIAALWLLEPVRTASLLAHLGAAELPYLRFGAVAAVGLGHGFRRWAVSEPSRCSRQRGEPARLMRRALAQPLHSRAA